MDELRLNTKDLKTDLRLKHLKSNYQVVSATYLLVCFLSLKKTTFETWEKMKLDQFVSITKEKNLSKNSTNAATRKLVPGSFVFAKIKHNLYYKMQLLKQATYIRYVLVKLFFFCKIT